MNPQDHFENDRKVFSFSTPTPSAIIIYDTVMEYLEQIKSCTGIYDIKTTMHDDGTFTVSMPLSLWEKINRE